MGNPFFNRFGPQQPQTGPFGNLMNMLTQFNQFRSQFQGNPQEKVQELLNTGQMSQDQFNQLSSLANQFRGLIQR